MNIIKRLNRAIFNGLVWLADEAYHSDTSSELYKLSSLPAKKGLYNNRENY